MGISCSPESRWCLGGQLWGQKSSGYTDEVRIRNKSENGKTDRHTGPWPQRIDDLEAILQVLFVSDDDRAIEIFDEIQRVIERKHMAMEKRIAII